MKALALLLLSPAIAIAASNHGYNVYNPSTYDVCQTQFTMQHYMQGKCVEIERPLKIGSEEKFKLRAVKLSTDLNAKKKILIIIPGGPGESSGMLRYVLNEKDMLNGMIKHMDLHVVLFDPRGTGSSKFAKPVEEYDPSVVRTQSMTDDLLALANAVSPDEPVYLLAHSAGGSVATQFSIQNPERVKKIVMASASTSPRLMALAAIDPYAKRSAVWERFKADPKHASLPLQRLDQKYKKIEDDIYQQTKARVLKVFEHPKAPMLSVSNFRDKIQVESEADPSGVSAANYINSMYAGMREIEKASDQLLAPIALRALPLRPDQLPKLVFKKDEWIKAAVVCGEGLTTQEMNTPVYYEGATMARFCNGFHAANERDIVTADLARLQTPVLYLAGLKDTQVPPHIARKIVSELPNATLVMEPNAGHAVFYDAPGAFYKAVDNFLK